ncbi:MAG: lamin tail domain-containing protein, partial [Planctomycetes bacterium]|nr:lamin tail domain-containing protein [Planctomycetota bacterium]
VDAGLGFDGSGDPILPTEDPGPGPGPGDLPGASPVVINEGLLRTGGELWIELYNRSAGTVDLAGYYITDDPSFLTKSEIAGPLPVAAGGFISFTETELGMYLSIVEGVKDRVFLALVEPSGDVVADAINFEPKHDGYSEARIPDGGPAIEDGADPTREAPNATSASTSIAINEVMYHPIDGDRSKEYIEIYNRGAAPVDVSGWALTDGVDFTIPGGVIMPPDSYLVIARDPERIRAIYGLGADAVIGPAPGDAAAQSAFGALRDSGERITLSDALGRTVDTLAYADGGEWPRWADGSGSSLERIDPLQDGSFGQAWDSSDDSGKAETMEFHYIGRHGGGDPELNLLLLDRGIAFVDDISVSGGVSYLDTPLVEVGEEWSYFKGTEEPPAGWTDAGFNDASWLVGPTGIGYADGDDATILDDMQNNYLTIFCRKEFDVADPAAIDQLWLSITIDDGFVAYLNGSEVARFHVVDSGDGAVFDDPASACAADGDLVETDITSLKSLLVAGTNVLAVRVHNCNLPSSDLTFIPRLVDRSVSVGVGTEYLVNGDFESNTAGWMIQGNHIRSGRSTQDVISGSGSLKLIATGRGDNKVNRLRTPEVSGFGLATLPTGLDLQISFKARWVVGSPTILTHGYQHAMARAHYLHVPEDLGTPGRVNSVTLRQIARSGGNLGPVMTDLRQSPAVPGDGEDVTVTIRISDSDGVDDASVGLYYSLNNPSASPARLAMSPVGGGYYSASIPGRPLGTKVVFFITAADQLGTAGRYPADVSERTHPELLRPEAPGLGQMRHLIYRHDTRLPSTPYHSYRFVMTDADEAELGSRLNLSNELLPGSFIFGGDRIYHESFIRFSGSPFA